jgi:hypothetical protein
MRATRSRLKSLLGLSFRPAIRLSEISQYPQSTQTTQTSQSPYPAHTFPILQNPPFT